MRASEAARTADRVAWLAPAALLCAVAYLAAAPILTDDLWFHLKAGETYAREGPWPAADPMLHTAHEAAPVQHEWLFGVAVHALASAVGLQGLRVVHLLAVLGIAAFAHSLFRRASASRSLAALATAVFLALSWWRLIQLRPDLPSIAAALATYRLLLEQGEPPSARRIAGFALLLAVWANLHSLFAIGPLLVAAALAGLALQAVLRRVALGDPDWSAERARGVRLAAALVLGLAASLANPRGAAQHLTFVTSSLHSGIWGVADEWLPFDPFAWGPFGLAESPLAWILTEALLAAFAGAAALAAWRLARRPSRETLARLDAPHLALGVAGLAAILVSIRFRWLCVFPLLFLLRAAPARGWAGPGAALCALAIAAAYPLWGGYRSAASLVPARPAEYLARVHAPEKYHAEGVRFLARTGLRGNLYNSYWMGGFLGYWLAPGLRTFIDGRVEHYLPDVQEDASTIAARRVLPPEQSFLGVLDRRRVDVFFGVGLPPTRVGPWAGVYTAAHLEGRDDWVLVFRAVDQGIYLRRAGGEAGLRAVESFYRSEGVPFDPARGLDVERVMAERPDWAERWRLLPRGYGRLRAEARGDGPEAQRARETLASAYAAAGAYVSATEAAREAVRRDPRHAAARRILVYALLRSGRDDEALREASRLAALEPGDPRAGLVATVARSYRAIRQAADGRSTETLLMQFPLLDAAEKSALTALYTSDCLP